MSKYPIVLDKKCKNCDGVIIAKRSRDLSKEFCGTSCVGKYHKTKEKEYVPCGYCGEEFVKTSKTKNKFCSKKCSDMSRRVEYKLNCKQCGEEFVLHNKAEINRGGGKFCSNVCRGEYHRKYYFAFDYFNNIDSEEKAYWLGFIYADGNIYRNTLTIKLNNKDYEHIVKFNESINSNYPIKTVDNTKSVVSLYHRYLQDSLSNVGVIPNKTFTVEMPKLENDLYRHFIRGVFDGDGCISVSKLGYRTVNIFTASEKFKDGLISTIPIKMCVYERDNGYSIQIHKKDDVDTFYEYLYKDGGICLERKKDKF